MNIHAHTLTPSATLRWLFLDMNSFFASCEQQADPALRGRPVAVVPMLADTTCAIAASAEAKRYGIRTGTLVAEARRLCPAIQFVQARPKVYVDYHHRFLDAIERYIPVEDVMSIDEVACRLDKRQQDPEQALDLARRIKAGMRSELGDVLTCSIGLAGNKLLAKLASDMQKPDGLVMLHPRDMPDPILSLPTDAVPGIGRNMQARLLAAGLTTMQDLWAADATFLRRVWGGVTGARFHALLHGVDLASPVHPRRSIGHQHVLAPDQRSLSAAYPVMRQLLIRAAQRLRVESFYARRLILDVKWMQNLGSHVDEVRCAETQDTAQLLTLASTLWRRLPALKPLRVGITLADLVPASAHQFDLFEKPRNAALTATIDKINQRYGRGSVAYAASDGPETSKIAFSRVPDRAEVTERENGACKKRRR